MADHSVKTIDKIIIHCSASREDRDYTFEQLLKDHKARGFNTCGYHIFIRKNGQRHIGRPFSVRGAHAAPYNTNSIGICYEGGLDSKLKAKDTRTDIQKVELIKAITEVLQAVRTAGGDTKKIKIIGHRDISPDLDGDGIVEPHEWIKMCPCFEAEPEYKNLVKLF